MIPVKIQCVCGQRFAFEVEPVNGQMANPVACPVCGADGTAAANAIIAQSLAATPEPSPEAGGRLRMVASTPTAHSAPPTPPPIPLRSIQPAAGPTPNLAWYEHVWIALPFALIAIGGAIGGACGGAAWAINKSVFKKTINPVLRYVWTGLISAAAVIVYLVIAVFVLSLFHLPFGNKNVTNWKPFSSPDGNFSALFPGEPEVSTKTESIIKIHLFVSSPNRSTSFMVSYNDMPEILHVSPTDKFFEGTRNGAVGATGQLVQEKTISVNGFPGREIQVEKSHGEAIITDRYFLAGNRLYQVMAIVSKENRDSTNIQYFLDSFSLLKTNAP